MRAFVGTLCIVLAIPICASAAVATTSAPAATTTKTILKCKDQIDWPNKPPAGYSVVLERVALPTGYAFGAARTRGSQSPRPYFAKQALLIKPGASFELIVPDAWKTRVTISWGNPGKETNHLWVGGCHSKKSGARWLAFAGGFTISKPACVPLIVKSGTKQKTVHIGAGKACPGQSPPPTV